MNDKELGGYVNPETGEVLIKNYEAGEFWVKSDLQETKERRKKGWFYFHTHCKGSNDDKHIVIDPLGVTDIIRASISGSSEYIIAYQMIYEVKPTIFLEPEELPKFIQNIVQEIDDKDFTLEEKAFDFVEMINALANFKLQYPAGSLASLAFFCSIFPSMEKKFKERLSPKIKAISW